MNIDHNQLRKFADDLLAEVGKTMFDVEDVVRLSVVALYADGHVLLEGNPGMGKTELVKTLGQVLQLPFGRIQFTPDLMPSDITGTHMPDFQRGGQGNWVFRRGPVFTSLLLADEINRASPKTQSALLEAMAERQVTVLGQTHRLDGGGTEQQTTPFMVLATQNPIDHEGTYELPEAQTDRFMFKIYMNPPQAETLCDIMDKVAGSGPSGAGSSPSQPIASRDASLSRYDELRNEIRRVNTHDALRLHIPNMVLASNRQFDELKASKNEPFNKEQKDNLEQLTRWFRFGFGPRAAIMLMLGARAWSLLWDNRPAADGSHLARVLVPTLRHRMLMNFDWEREYAEFMKLGKDAGVDIHASFLREFCLKTAPNDEVHKKHLKEVL